MCFAVSTIEEFGFEDLTCFATINISSNIKMQVPQQTLHEQRKRE
jgi:hypothetical protein